MKKILIAGGTGLVGSAVTNLFQLKFEDVTSIGKKDVDLTNEVQTARFIEKLSPDLVVDSAATVGGILANKSFPVDFYINNIKIQNNLMQACHQSGVARFIFLGSSCIYPKLSKQPIKEEYLHTGKLESTNSAYAIAKISGIELVKSYRKQYKKDWISVIPSNIYGPKDNFDLYSSHVLPALVRKIVDAKEKSLEAIELWGTGKPKREFLFSSDLAEALLVLNEKYHDEEPINVGTGEEITIEELAVLISGIVGYRGQIKWDNSKPDGTPRKVLEISKITELGWKPKISLEEGISLTVDWYLNYQLKVIKQ